MPIIPYPYTQNHPLPADVDHKSNTFPPYSSPTTAVETEGVFRIAGSQKRMRELQETFDLPPRVSKHSWSS